MVLDNMKENKEIMKIVVEVEFIKIGRKLKEINTYIWLASIKYTNHIDRKLRTRVAKY